VGDVISNLHFVPSAIKHSDVFLGQCGEDVKQTLAPELLITFGKSVISKNLKQFLRKYKPAEHWHIQPSGNTADTFQSLTRIIHCTPQHFFENVVSNKNPESFDQQKKANYVSVWKAEENRTNRHIKTFFNETKFSEFAIIKELIDALPARCNLHLANSMTVRYANFIGLTEKNKGVHVFANRGTSGIDGCTSTAVGHTLSSNVPNILITGDMAFFYDRNAFWHNYELPNMHVVVINNQGGVIFNLIDGPSNLEEKDQYFVTKQKLTAANLAQEFGFDYLKLDAARKIKNLVKDFFEFEGKNKILEVVSDQKTSKETFEQFKNTIKKSYDA
jgi:2-succinyl-5-enolpyruvyl-6-hydroxy-3-cyclohexene-1-carboxylate synthase